MELKKIEAGQREAVAKVASLFLSLQPEEQLKLCSMLIDLERKGVSYAGQNSANPQPVAPVQPTEGE